MKSLDLIRVLLVEDEEGDAYLVKIGLKQTKSALFEIIWARSMQAMRVELATGMFDVVLLDISLPDSEGLETIQTAKQLVADIPIVVLTGQADSDFALKALTAGAADYMVKGDFGFDGLSRIICYALARKEMETENNLLVTALTSAANAIIITDKNAIIKWANPAFYKLTGYAAYETIGRRPSELLKSDRQDDTFYQDMWRVLLSGENWRGEIINRRKDGSLYHEELNIASVKNSIGEITHFVGIKEDISERKNFEERLQKLASTDSLTGLFNRRVFMERLEQEIARYHRIGSGSAAILMLDLDFFKRVNDTFGHAMGDEVLKRLAAIMISNARHIDVTARLGGEEFAIILPSTDIEGAFCVADRIREQVAAETFVYEQQHLQITVSIGLTTLKNVDTSAEKVLIRADKALYVAKESGRNRTCVEH